MNQEFQVGDRVISRSGTVGTIIEPDFDMPNHHLILLDGGNKLYILRRILQPASEPAIKSKRKSRAVRFAFLYVLTNLVNKVINLTGMVRLRRAIV